MLTISNKLGAKEGLICLNPINLAIPVLCSDLGPVNSSHLITAVPNPEPLDWCLLHLDTISLPSPASPTEDHFREHDLIPPLWGK